MRRLLALASLLCLAVPAASAQPAAEAKPVMRVVTGLASPFVKLPGTPVSGYSIEIWREVARRLGVETAWTVLPDLSDAAQIAAVAEGRADVAISALAVTAERDAMVDFTLPYFHSGLQVLVGTGGGGAPWWLAILGLAQGGLLTLFGAAAAVVLVLAHLLWLVERPANPAFRRGYLSSIAEGVWGVMVIFSTGEHGDRDTPRPVKRIIVGSLWLAGVVLIAQFTAALTSSLTVDQLRSGIEGPSDLPGRRIATAPGSGAAGWLEARDLPFVPLTDLEAAHAMLARGELDAVVYEAPQLRYWLANRGRSMVALVGPVFGDEPYAIAVALGSPLRKRINHALLEMAKDGSAAEIRQRWFGAP